MPRKKQYTDAEIKVRQREATLRWEAKNPDKIAAKRARDNAKQKERRAQARAAKEAQKILSVSAPPVGRICRVCNEDKPMAEFGRHGSGWKQVCLVCNPPPKKGARQAEWAKRNAEKVKAKKREWAQKKRGSTPRPERKQETPKKSTSDKIPWTDKMVSQGWRKLGGVGDMCEQLMVYLRGPIILFQRGALGTYTTPKATYGVIGDDTGARYVTLSSAMKAAEKQYGPELITESAK